MQYVASDLGPTQLIILGEKAEEHNDGVTVHDRRPDKTTVFNDNWELHLYFSQRRAVLEPRGLYILTPDDVFPERYCGVWEFEHDLKAA